MGTNAQAMITATVIYPAAKGCFNDGFQGRIGMKRILLAIVFFMCCVLCLAGPATQPVKPDYSLGDVFEYDGDLGGKLSIGMTLRISDDAKTATGCYFYYKYCKDIRVDGTIDGRKIVMHEYDGNGHETGRFVGEFPAVDPRHHFQTANDLQTEVITGYWSKPDGSKSQPFYLSQTFSGSWLPGSRYVVAGFEHEHDVDVAMARFRQAVLDANADRVAGMVQYPIAVWIDSKRVTINDAQDFRSRYDKIFAPAFVERIRQSPPFHLFARDQGVMLGNGEIWMAPARRDGKAIPVVIAINNDIGSRRR